jgi:NAD(P)-dependent dehydrogenase (short-subunit alcohol dehydrogenase family)
VPVLRNNAGVFIVGSLAETSAEEWVWLLAVNVMGVVNGVRSFLPYLRAQGGDAHIVNTGSISGYIPPQNQGAYTASKYGVVGYSERLRAELAAEGIGVSVLCPSGVGALAHVACGNSPAVMPPSITQSWQLTWDPSSLVR